MNKKVIALVGRPNVGKSTLFNRLGIRKKAIVHDMPGVTRDRKYSDARIGPMEFTIIDTPGLEESDKRNIEYRMMEQTMEAIREADLVCLIVDNLEGLTPADKYFANQIRKSGQNYLLVANKSEKKFNHDKEYYKLGFGTPIPISAEHNQGFADLHDAIAEKIDVDDFDDVDSGDFLNIVIAGRPNAGKSTFINSITKSQRMLTGPEAGITRESVDIMWNYDGYDMKLIDTAGLRRRSNVTGSLEKMSTGDTIGSINFANIVILMLDATVDLKQQDLTIANYAINQGRGLVIAVNKWDLIDNKESYRDQFFYRLEKHLSQVKDIPVVFMSAINNKKTTEILDCAINIYKLWEKRISTSKLNDWLAFTIAAHPLPIHKKLGRRVRIKYITQIKTRPPTFKLFASDPASITDSYKKYLINSLRENFDLPGVPIRMYFAKTNNPYAKRK